jgi:calpain-7
MWHAFGENLLYHRNIATLLHLLQKYRSLLQSAASKDEALSLAISAAENLMKALKLSSDPGEKKQLKAQCGEIMDTAGRIKNDANWEPTAGPDQARTKNEQIGQWAAEVVSAQSPTPTPEDTASQSSLSRHGLSSTTAPIDNVSIPSGKISISSISRTDRPGYDQEPGFAHKATHGPVESLIDPQDNHSSSPLDAKMNTHTDARHKDRPSTQPSALVDREAHLSMAIPLLSSPIPHVPGNVTHEGAASTLPSPAPYSHIRRLAEPVSTRKRSKREDIILLKASMLNGFKCPPWDKNPVPSEFVLQQDTALFV